MALLLCGIGLLRDPSDEALRKRRHDGEREICASSHIYFGNAASSSLTMTFEAVKKSVKVGKGVCGVVCVCERTLFAERPLLIVMFCLHLAKTD